MLISKIIYIISIHFQTKNILKNNFYHACKKTLDCLLKIFICLNLEIFVEKIKLFQYIYKQKIFQKIILTTLATFIVCLKFLYV